MDSAVQSILKTQSEPFPPFSQDPAFASHLDTPSPPKLTVTRDLDSAHLDGRRRGGRGRPEPPRSGRRRRQRGGEESGEEEAVGACWGEEGAGGRGGDGGGSGGGRGRHGKRGHGANTRAEEAAARGSDKRAHGCCCGGVLWAGGVKAKGGRRRRPKRGVKGLKKAWLKDIINGGAKWWSNNLHPTKKLL